MALLATEAAAQVSANVQQSKVLAIKLDAHEGLRGIAACWVMLFHAILFSKCEFDFQGSSLMPMFFILSGFALAAVYGGPGRQWQAPPPRCCGREKTAATAAPAGDEDKVKQLKPFQTRRFYRNRIARTMPTYYLTNLAALPFWFFGFGSAAPSSAAFFGSILVTLLPVSTLLCFTVGYNLDGPSWTVVTLLFMWYQFPRWLPSAQRKTDEELLRSIVHCYWIQLAVLCVVFVVVIVAVGDFWIAFSAATMNPISRFPVFMMGGYAGVLCNRHSTDALPWPKALFRFLPYQVPKVAPPTAAAAAGSEQEAAAAAAAMEEQCRWAKVATLQSVFLFLLTLSVSCADIADRVAGGGGIMGAVWLQALVPFAQLEVVVALTRDGGASRAAKALSMPLARWLGKVGMALYLVHLVILNYLLWIVNGGKLSWPNEWNCDNLETAAAVDACNDTIDDFNDARLIPLWGIPVICGVSFGVAAAVFYGFEEPLRRALRGGQ